MLTPINSPLLYRRLFSLAERDSRRALLFARQVLEHCHEDHPHRGWALFALGWALLRAEHFDDATKHLHEALAHFEMLGQRDEILDCRRALLIIALLQGAGEWLQAEWSVLVDNLEQRGRLLDMSRARIQQAAHLNILGRPRDALTLIHLSEHTITVEGTPDDRARLLRVKAIAHANLGRLDEAEILLAESLDLFRRHKLQVEVAKCLFERAHLCHRREQFRDALANLKQAIPIFERSNLPMQIAFCHKSSGLALSRLGYYGEALSQTLAARTVFVELSHHRQIAQCDLNLGLMAYYSGLWDLALAAYCHAETTFHDLGEIQLELVSRRNQVYILRALGQFDTAFELLTALEEPVQRLGDRVEYAEIVHLEAKLLLDLGKQQSALQRLQQSHTLWSALNHQASMGDCLLDEGFLYLSRGDISQAYRCFEAARNRLDERPAHLWRINYGLGRCVQADGHPSAALDYYCRASTIIAGLRRSLASEHASSGLFTQAQPLFVDALQLAAELGDLEAVLRLTEEQRALALRRQMIGISQDLPVDLRRRAEAFQHELHAALDRKSLEHIDELLMKYREVLFHTRHAHVPDERPDDTVLDISALRHRFDALYPSGWVVLTYTECQTQLLIVTLTTDTLDLTSQPIDASFRSLLDEATLPRYRRFTYLDYPRKRDPQQPPWQTLAKLTACLLPEAVRIRLTPDTRLLITPSALLHAVPWSALRVGEHWLCERAVIHLLPNLSLWPYLGEDSNPSSAALLLGCSEFDGRAAPLVDVAVELDEITKRWPGPVRRCEDTAATSTALLQMGMEGALRQFCLLHLTTHAQSVSAGGLLAHIKLRDGNLLLDDVLQLGLARAIVVLSVCEGATSEVLPGEEWLSLQRVFLAAGACDVVASLWPVYERAARSLLLCFYDRLAVGDDVPTALTFAQRKVLRSDESFASPLTWASWYIFGVGSAVRTADEESCSHRLHSPSV